MHAFQKKVLDIVKKIPRGKLMIYMQLAKKLHSSPRAVGRALATNPFPDKVPCFRVVMSNCKVGGYKLGAKQKIKLLKKDGFTIKNGKILRLTKKAIFG